LPSTTTLPRAGTWAASVRFATAEPGEPTAIDPMEAAVAISDTAALAGASRYRNAPSVPPGASSVRSSVDAPVTVTGPMPGADAARATAERTATGWPPTMNTAPRVEPTIVIEPMPVAADQVEVRMA
jgi:hypothetical protein